jgi:hypothetical protein
MRFLALLLMTACIPQPPTDYDDWDQVTPPIEGVKCHRHRTGFGNTRTSTVNCFPGISDPQAVQVYWKQGISPVAGYTCWFYSTGFLDLRTQASTCFRAEP